uniref:Uncharacterized protein n=1 Tax=Calcidiscus leptoporus TaxID=127549 RepID=A0A7S0IWE8_9EUKA|mmetsp:Transcript_25500/g.59467  ORF Transcript_25500/g.59467 Transcript_25500/m.59467 type:complete len:140 (+) Transcript_25500:96-515(+)|eukprot:CAMPEP_0119369610 /NCGR_PEP_ID=MMETSP1334-20130426/16105_1 /TAXON_ID=127549 /ORGANISM="Calcidiscus leptoporus, Strain RCC1130" /LENGTH=139 /DNA_ID=CAMNT_0007386493 /DNA_START=151 /DNA_END=570 /DNA_ORIENTATION=-
MPQLRQPRLLLCTDDPRRALQGGLAAFEPALLAPLLRDDAARWTAAHAACNDALSDGALEMLCDWVAIRSADVIATANSTFSFTAALLAFEPRASAAGVPRFWRPHPSERRLVPFDPWSSQPLLNAARQFGQQAHTVQT